MAESPIASPRPGRIVTPVPSASLNAELLRQGADVIGRLRDDVYSASTPLLPGGTIGKHMRHCVEFYQAFLDGLSAGAVDYESRGRDPVLEEVRGAMIGRLTRLADDLEALPESALSRPIRAKGEGAPLAEPPEDWPASTVGRELYVLASHTVHHYALVAVLLRTLGEDPGESFGVAPSTLRHWKALRP